MSVVRTLALVSVALVSRLAFAAEEEAARRWKADGAMSYMTSEDFTGFGVTVGMLRTAGPYFAGGLIEHENTQCGYGSGLVIGGGGGIDVAFSRTMSAGVRGSARTMAGTAFCHDVGGPASFYTVVLLSLGASFDVHW